MRVIRGRKALVTGAASGIGRAIALALAREGADLFLLDIQGETLATVVQESRTHGVEVIGRRCDVGKTQEIAEGVDSLLGAWGRLDILVNNAGILYYGDTEKMTDEQWDRILAVNLQAPIRFIRHLLPVLREQPEAHILNVCSVAGLVPKRRLAAYQTTKFGLVGLSASLRAEYSPGGLGVTALCPGPVDTGLLEAARARDWLTSRLNPPAFLQASPDRVAARAIRAIQRNQGLVVVTAYARVLWALQRLSPRILDTWQHFKRRRRHP